ncbi:hypothetical protein SRABI96_03604 [Peribacillus sp. Bi96]|nr:hypothetical protein SRABI96_03604 [Peribacillus sp. Bi96]
MSNGHFSFEESDEKHVAELKESTFKLEWL